MGLSEELAAEVKSTFLLQWEEQKALTVPSPEDLRLNANHAKDLETATVLYADLDGSTKMVDNYKWWFSAEIYKTFLRCAAQVIRSEGGTVTAYDGDRVMAIFTGDSKNTSAVRAALKINYAVNEIIMPALETQYAVGDFNLKHVVGIDTSELRTARIGVRGDTDLVWIGRAANYAAKLTSISGFTSLITKTVYESINDEVKFDDTKNIWTPHIWQNMNNMEIYSSNFWLRIP